MIAFLECYQDSRETMSKRTRLTYFLITYNHRRINNFGADQADEDIFAEIADPHCGFFHNLLKSRAISH